MRDTLEIMKIVLPLALFVICGCTSQSDTDHQAQQHIANAQAHQPASPDRFRLEHLNQRLPSAIADRVRAYSQAHPDADQKLLENLKNAIIITGMDKEQVRVIMGQPWHVETSGGVGGSFDQWTYLDAATMEPDIFLYFGDGKLVRWQNLQ